MIRVADMKLLRLMFVNLDLQFPVRNLAFSISLQWSGALLLYSTFFGLTDRCVWGNFGAGKNSLERTVSRAA